MHVLDAAGGRDGNLNEAAGFQGQGGGTRSCRVQMRICTMTSEAGTLLQLQSRVQLFGRDVPIGTRASLG